MYCHNSNVLAYSPTLSNDNIIRVGSGTSLPASFIRASDKGIQREICKLFNRMGNTKKWVTNFRSYWSTSTKM